MAEAIAMVRLNGECNELALFLSGPSPSSANKTTLKVQDKDVGMEKLREGNQQLITEMFEAIFSVGRTGSRGG